MKVLAAIYTHPEFYPPTINLVEALAGEGHLVTILCSNNAKEISHYANGIDVVSIGDFIPIRSVGQRSTLEKVKHWLSYTLGMRRLLRHTDMVILYDPIPLLSYRIASIFLKKPRIVWYHNHDIMEIEHQRKYSISWWAAKNEPRVFPKLDIFSLPAEERKAFFPMDKLKGKYIYLPNFPSLRRYGSLNSSQKSDTEWRIIFQGSIGPGHGIEEICQLLPMEYEHKPVKLLLKGFVSDEFKQGINAILETRRAMESVEWVGVTSYEALAPLTAGCHLGIAIFTGKDVMNRTLGTASNKIYEYVASGVPILYYKDEHFNKYLKKYDWAIETNLSENSLKASIEYAFNKSEELSNCQKRDFNQNLNFEKHFQNSLRLVTLI